MNTQPVIERLDPAYVKASTIWCEACPPWYERGLAWETTLAAVRITWEDDVLSLALCRGHAHLLLPAVQAALEAP